MWSNETWWSLLFCIWQWWCFCGNQTLLPCRQCCRKSWRGGKIRRCCIAKLLEITWHGPITAHTHYRCSRLLPQNGWSKSWAAMWALPQMSRCVTAACDVPFDVLLQVLLLLKFMEWIFLRWILLHHIEWWIMFLLFLYLIISTQIAVSLSLSLLHFLYLLRSIWSTCIWAPAASLNFLGSQNGRIQNPQTPTKVLRLKTGGSR